MSEAPLVNRNMSDDVCVLTLNDPAHMNVLSPRMREQLMRCFDDAVEAPEVRAIVITGAGGHFSAGGDLSAMTTQTTAERMTRLQEFQQFAAGWRRIKKPILVAAEGNVAGGGVAMTALADYAVAGTSARFTAGWIAIGLAPDVGVLWSLSRSMQRKAVWDWLTSGRRMPAAEARDNGIVTATCADGEALTTTIGVAKALATLPAPAVAASKLLMADADHLPLEGYLDRERNAMAALFETVEHHEAVTAFLERNRRRA